MTVIVKNETDKVEPEVVEERLDPSVFDMFNEAEPTLADETADPYTILQPTVEEDATVVPLETPFGRNIVEGLTGAEVGEEDDVTVLEEDMILEDKRIREQAVMETINNIASDNNLDSEARATLALGAAEQATEARTIGEIYSGKFFSMPDPEVFKTNLTLLGASTIDGASPELQKLKAAASSDDSSGFARAITSFRNYISTRIDRALVRQKYEDAIAKEYGTSTYDAFVRGALLTGASVDGLISSVLGQGDTRGWKKPKAVAKALGEAITISLNEAGKTLARANEAGVGLGVMKTGTGILLSPSVIGEAAVNIGTLYRNLLMSPFDGERNMSIKEVAEFVSMIPFEDGPPVEDMMKEMWRHINDEDSDGTVSPEFSQMAEKRWGEMWKWRMAAFMLKEVGVDGMALVLASANPAGASRLALKAGTGATASLRTRLAKALNRTAVMAVAGATVQSGINRAAGQDPDVVYELATRGLGIGVFEMGSQVIIKGVRSTIGATTARLARDKGLKIHNPEVSAVLKQITDETGTPMSILIEASKATLTKEFRRLRKLVAEGIATVAEQKQAQAMRSSIAKLFKISEEEVDLVPVWHSVQEELVLKSISDGKAFREITESSKGLIGEEFKLTTTIDTIAKEVDTLRFGRSNVKGGNLQKRMEAAIKRKDDAARLLAKAKSAAVATRHNNAITKAETELARIHTDIEANVVRNKTAIAQAKANIADNKTARGAYRREIQDHNKRLTALQKANPEGFQYWSQLAESVVSSKAVSLRSIMGTMAEQKDDVLDVFLAGLAGTQFSARLPGSRAWGAPSLMRRIFRPVMDPNDTLPPLASVEDTLMAQRVVGRTKAQFKKMWVKAVKGLSNEDYGHAMRLLEEGSDAEKVFEPHELVGAVPDMAIDAYYRIRGLLDMTHAIHDQALVKEMRLLGYRQMPDGTTVKVLQRSKLTEAERKQGWVMAQPVTYGAVTPPPVRIKKGTLEPLSSVLGYHVGYTPRAYKNARWSLVRIDAKGGVVETVDAFPSINRARDAMGKLAKSNENPDSVAYAVHKWNDQADEGVLMLNRQTMRLFDTADDETITAIQQALNNAGINEQAGNLRMVFDDLTGKTLNGPGVGPRGKKPLPSAELELTETAIFDYLNRVAIKDGTGEVGARLKRDMVSLYGTNGTRLGDNMAPLVTKWDDPLSGLAGNRQAEARAFQNFIKKFTTFKTLHETWWPRMVNRQIRQMALSGSRFSRSGATMADALPNMQSLFGFTRMTVGTAFLMSVNLGQTLVQVGQAAATMGVSPRHSAAAAMDMFKAGAALGLERAGRLHASVEAKQLLNAIRITGLMTDLGTTDIVSFAERGTPPLSRMIEIYGSAGGLYNYMKQGTSKLAKGGVDLSAVPLKLGEGLNRSFAFFLNRRKFIDEMAKSGGRLIDRRTGAVVKTAIDSPEFLKMVADQATVTALNMTKSGQIAATSGVGSVMFQFWQVVPKTFRMFASSRLTPAERLSAAATMVGFYGVGGIPMTVDLWNFADNLLEKVPTTLGGGGSEPKHVDMLERSGNALINNMAEVIAETDQHTLQVWGLKSEAVRDIARLIKHGGIAALTDGQVRLAHRLTVQNFLNEQLDQASVFDRFAFVSFANRAVFNKDSSVSGLMAYFDSLTNGSNMDDSFYKVAHRILKETGKTVTSFGNLANYLENVNQHELNPLWNVDNQQATIVTKNGRETGLPITDLRLAQMLTGLQPGEVVERRTIEATQREYRTKIRDWVEGQYKLARMNFFIDKEKYYTIIFETFQNLEATRVILEDEGTFRPKVGQTTSGLPKHVTMTHNQLVRHFSNRIMDIQRAP